MVSSRGMFVNKLVTSKDLRDLPYVFSCLIPSMKVKVSLVVKFDEHVVKVKSQDIEGVYNYKYL